MSIEEAIIKLIIEGDYQAGLRFPPEREFCDQLGVSRSKMRESLKVLESWNVIKSKRSSGISVVDKKHWKLQVMPYFLKYGINEDYYTASLVSLLDSRRNLIVTMLGMLPDSGIDLQQARESAEQAWINRHQPSVFTLHDSLVVTHICVAANLYSITWMWNSISDIYQKVGSIMPIIFNVPENYLAVYEEIFIKISEHKIEAAQKIVNDYIRNMDDKIINTTKILLNKN